MVDYPRDLVEKYEILDKIGEGGMGLVYKARHRYLQRFDVVKLIHSRLFVSDEQKRNFIREAEITAQLKNHKNVVTVYGAGGETQTPYILYEYVKGTPLDKRIKEAKRIPLREALFFGREICEGMSFAHGLGIVHRDLKSENVILSDQLEDGFPVPRIADFGIAKAKEQAKQQAKKPPLQQAMEHDKGQAKDKPSNWHLFGTPSYMSPEQAAGEEATERSDLYSIGIILYEMLAGEVPFKGTALQVIMKHIHEDPPPLNQVNAQVPEQVAELVHRALAKDAAQRFASAEEMASRLDKAFKLAEKWMREASGKITTSATRTARLTSTGLRSGQSTSGATRPAVAQGVGTSGSAGSVGVTTSGVSGRVGQLGRDTSGVSGEGGLAKTAAMKPPTVMERLAPYKLQLMILAASVGVLGVSVVWLLAMRMGTGAGGQAYTPRDLAVKQGLKEVLVTWKSEAAYASVIEYGENDSAMTPVKGGPEARTDHEVKLVDLKPGTRYYCRIVYPGGDKSLPSNFTIAEPMFTFTWSRLGTKGVLVEGDTFPPARAELVYERGGARKTAQRQEGDLAETSHTFKVDDFAPDSDKIVAVHLTFPTGEGTDVTAQRIKER